MFFSSLPCTVLLCLHVALDGALEGPALVPQSCVASTPPCALASSHHLGCRRRCRAWSDAQSANAFAPRALPEDVCGMRWTRAGADPCSTMPHHHSRHSTAAKGTMRCARSLAAPARKPARCIWVVGVAAERGAMPNQPTCLPLGHCQRTLVRCGGRGQERTPVQRCHTTTYATPQQPKEPHAVCAGKGS